MNAFQVVLEVLVERHDLLVSRNDAQAVSRSGQLVDKAVVVDIPPQSLPRDIDLQLVRHEGKQVFHRDSLSCGVSRVDEVYDTAKNITDLAWPSTFWSLFLGVFPVVLF